MSDFLARGDVTAQTVPPFVLPEPREVAAVITAAGFSSRMGSPKALLEWGEKPLLQHQIDVLAAFGQVVVVLGHEAEHILERIAPNPNTRLVVHPGYSEGRSSSLQAGSRAIIGDPRGLLVLGTDQPLDERVLCPLLQALGPETSLAVPVKQGRRGHPVLLAGFLLPELRQVAQEPEGLRTIVRRHHAKSVEVPIDLDAPWWDLNTPDDYAQAIATPPRG
ncbi:MAG TPA: nucleotidyltransferase family protein [Stenomitos sp.]